ncbi:MAG: hypothetical protein AAFU41_16495 [Pseudomonadota bacterium]
MKRRLFSTIAIALFGLQPTHATADSVMWQPSDFDGVWVEIIDHARNGCWTNLIESREYGEGQLELAGFSIVEQPSTAALKRDAMLDLRHAMLVVEVEAVRLENGLCVGHVMTRIMASVISMERPTQTLVSVIGTVDSWTIWSRDNLNNYVLDHIKKYVAEWKEIGSEVPQLD